MKDKYDFSNAEQGLFISLLNRLNYLFIWTKILFSI